MRDYVLVPKEDLIALEVSRKDLIAHIKYAGIYGDCTNSVTGTMWKLTHTKYRTAKDFAEPDGDYRRLTMNETLIITDVDFKDLEAQRGQLNGILADDSILSCMTAEQQDALASIINMLNEWSDTRYYNGVTPC